MEIADYEIVRTLGDAGYGVMYTARPPARLASSDELVGLKVLEVADDEAALRRATRELRAFAAVRSPHLVRLLDAGRDGTSFFYAMEYCARGSLAAPTTELGEEEVVRSVREAALAAHALHEAGLVHRGIKPANVLLHADGGARLADLGLVQALDPDQLMTGLGSVGSLEYVEPSLLTGHPAARASDVWSLGATLQHALTQKPLYDVPSNDPLLAVRIVLTQAPRIAEELPEPWAEVVRTCLAPAREDRYASALALADALG